MFFLIILDLTLFVNRFCELNSESSRKDETSDEEEMSKNNNLNEEWNKSRPISEMNLSQFNVLVKNTNFELEVRKISFSFYFIK